MDKKIKEKYVDLLAGKLSSQVFAEMQDQGPYRFRLDLGPESLCEDVAIRLSELMGQKEIKIGVMSSETAPPVSFSSDDLASMRNLMESMFVFVPDSTIAGEGTFDNSFRLIGASELLRAALDEGLQEFLQTVDFGEEKILREHLNSVGSHDGLVFISSILSEDSPSAWGYQLWRIGLVPDLGTEAETRLAKNIQIVPKLRATGRAFETATRRLIDAKVAKGDIFNRLELYLEEVPDDFHAWLKGLVDKDLTFEHWIFSEDKSGCVQSISVKSFRSRNGEPRKGLGFSSENNWLIADKGYIKVEWDLEPPNVENLDGFRVEILPVFYDDDQSQEPLFRTEKVKKNRKSLKITLDSDSDFDDRAEGTYFVRVTAIDEDGRALPICLESETTPEVASADSEEEFSVEVVSEEQSRADSAWSLTEAKLLDFLNGRDYGRLSASYYQGDTAVFQKNLGQTSRVNSPDFLRALHRLIGSRGVGVRYELNASKTPPVVLEQGDFVRKEFSLPEKLASARERLLTLLEEREEYFELVDFEDEISQLVSEYVHSYEESLLQATNQSEIHDLLTLDTVRFHIIAAHGKVSGYLVLPTNPLMAAWIHSLRSWVNNVIEQGSDTSQKSRRGIFDMDSFRQLQPRNLPFMIPFSESSSSGAASYESELAHGYSLYLDSTSQSRSKDAELCSYLFSARDSVSRRKFIGNRLGDRLKEFVNSRDLTNTLNIRGVNPGEGKYLSRSLRSVLKEDNGSPLNRISLTAYGSSGNYSAPLGELTALAREYNEAAPPSENFLTPRFRIRVLPELGEVSKRERADITIVESASKLVAAAKGPLPFSNSYLEDLALPSSFESNSGEPWSMVSFCNPPAKTSISMVLRAHNQAVAKLFGSEDPNQYPVFEIEMNAKDESALVTSHDDSSWVICLDETISLDLYKKIISKNIRNPYIIDYSPEFIEGLTSRMFISTGDRREMLRVVDRAISDFERESADDSAEKILSDVSRISPHMALKLLRDDSMGSEVVGLAATVKHMRNNRKSMVETVVIPVDEHRELFTVSRTSGKRCDLILVSLSSDGQFVFEYVEIKNHANITNNLLEGAASQVSETIKSSSFLPQSGSAKRLDVAIQWARWASIVEFHAERQYLSGDLSKEAREMVSRKLQSVPESPQEVLVARSIFALDLNNTADSSKLQGPTGFNLTIISKDQLAATGYFQSQNDFNSTSEMVPDDKPTEDRKIPDSQIDGPEMPLSSHESPSYESTIVKSQSVSVNLGEKINGEKAFWELSTSGAPHAVIAGKSGQGKSTLLRAIAGQLLSAGVPYLVLDYHGDFSTQNLEGVFQVDLSVEALPLNPFYPGPFAERRGQRLSPSALQIRDILTGIYKLGERQAQVVYESVMALYEEAGWDDFSDGEELSMSLFKRLLSEREKSLRQTEVSSRLIEFTDFGIFSDSSSDFDLSQPVTTIIDFSRGHGAHQNQSVRSSVASFILRKLYQEMFAWEKDSTLKLAVLLDEAHLFKFDKTIPSLLREGRKFGLSVIQASQSLEDFSGESFQNQGMLMSFALGPKETQKSKTYLGVDKEQILDLSPGEALVVRGSSSPAELVRVWSKD